MASKNEQERRETLADIVAQMRGRGEDGRMGRHLWNEYADRIEAAAKRVVVSKTETTTVGNAAAIREALVKAKKAICHYAKHVCQSLSWENSDIQSNCADVLCAHRDLCEAKTAINAALSAPPRQCDVGTAEEQAKRFNDFCSTHVCSKCVVHDEMARSFNDGILERAFSCRLVFSQMPYEAKEGGAS